MTIKLDIRKRAICPVCFRLYNKKPETANCSECYSEAITVDLISLENYLDENSLNYIQTVRAEWIKNKKQFSSTYFKTKRMRLDRLVEIKTEINSPFVHIYEEPIFKTIKYQTRTAEGSVLAGWVIFLVLLPLFPIIFIVFGVKKILNL